MTFDFGKDLIREWGSLPAIFNVLTRVSVSMTNDNCRTGEAVWRSATVSYTHLDVYKRQP